MGDQQPKYCLGKVRWNIINEKKKKRIWNKTKSLIKDVTNCVKEFGEGALLKAINISGALSDIEIPMMQRIECQWRERISLGEGYFRKLYLLSNLSF